MEAILFGDLKLLGFFRIAGDGVHGDSPQIRAKTHPILLISHPKTASEGQKWGIGIMLLHGWAVSVEVLGAKGVYSLL